MVVLSTLGLAPNSKSPTSPTATWRSRSVTEQGPQSQLEGEGAPEQRTGWFPLVFIEKFAL